jgi:hypothetical protein
VPAVIFKKVLTHIRGVLVCVGCVCVCVCVCVCGGEGGLSMFLSNRTMGIVGSTRIASLFFIFFPFLSFSPRRPSLAPALGLRSLHCSGQRPQQALPWASGVQR